MKKILMIVAILTASVSTAIAHTYVVPSEKGTSNDEPQLVAAHVSGGCVYADKAVKLGDTLIVDQDIVLVCASAPHGAVFYQLAQDGVKRVLAAVPAPSK
ncbi:hypothetical protein [Janthinobacterium sp. CAN_S7]|uniref:hypothetical protein n=1 Tax=Janthinobacterium sp. CAN_S7 TaxID=3071704 RepID=UPI00319E9432